MTDSARDASRGYHPRQDRYWAAEGREKIASAVMWAFRRYQDRLREEGRVDIWRVADLCYHGRNHDGGYANSVQITFGGEEGETALIHVGVFRRHLNGQLSLATSQRPNVEVTAVNGDPEAIASVQTSRQVLDYDLDEGLEENMVAAHERALLYSEGYVVQTWDVHAGEEIGTRQLAPEIIDGVGGGLPANDNGEAELYGMDFPVREGEVKVEVKSPMEVARDLDYDTNSSSPWYVVRSKVNRHDLAAQFPEDAEKRTAILDAPPAHSDDWTLWTPTGRRTSSDDQGDVIHVYTLYHLPTDAMPEGRQVVVVDGEWLYDDPYPYDHCVVHRDIPTEEIDRTTGYGDAWDMLALSQALDSVESAMLTVHDAGSQVNYVAARGQKVDAKMLETSMSIIEYDDDGIGRPPPGLMDRPEVRESDFKMSEHYETLMRTLSGQNAVVQGDPDANIKSGNFAALVASMAVQAINRQAAAYGRLMRSVLSGRLDLYKKFAETERLIEVVGRDKTGHVKSFTRSDLHGARRVKVELANPILRTLQGKMEIADKMLERYGPEQLPMHKYMSLMQTGQLDDIDNAEAEHKVIAKRENDMFRKGEGAQVMVLITDHHECHIAEHLKQLNDDSVRLDPAGVQHLMALSQHITEHANMWPMVPPALLAATGQKAIPAGFGPPPGPEGGPPAPGPVGPGGGGEPMMPGPENPLAAGPMPANDNGQSGMPELPANPITGEPAGPAMGVS